MLVWGMEKWSYPVRGSSYLKVLGAVTRRYSSKL
jgi:hypothetical protein